MKTIFRTYQFELHPTQEQKILLDKHFGCIRFVYNHFLNERKEQYQVDKKSDNYNTQAATLTKLKKKDETVWLKEVNSQSLQFALKCLDTAYINFFRGNAKFPRFKSKKNKNTFTIPKEQFDKLPNIGAKFAFGEKGNKIGEIGDHKPVFAFDFVSVKKSNFCFDSNLISGTREYQKIFHSLKDISTKTYNTLSNNHQYHFHEVNLDATSIKTSDFVKCLVDDASKVDKDDIPTVYQFKIFEEARIFGFIHNYVFYMVFFDRNHIGYGRKK